MPLNSHFVSRFLTKPWECEQRRLWFYDFTDKRLKNESSRRLFARVDAHEPEFEQRLNRLVETPIAAVRSTLWGAAEDVSQLQEWPLFRALALLVLLQPFRSSDHPDAPATLAKALQNDDSHLDVLVRSIGEQYRFLRVSVSMRSPLFYPSDGYFPLTCEPVDGGCSFGLAIPLSPQHAFVAVPQHVKREQTLLWVQNDGGFVSNYSVGHRSDRVVVHPSAVEALSDSKIATALEEARASVIGAIGLCRDIASVLERIDAISDAE